MAWDRTFKDPFGRISTPITQGRNRPRNIFTRIVHNIAFGTRFSELPMTGEDFVNAKGIKGRRKAKRM